MSKKQKLIKPDQYGDAIGEINYPVKIERACFFAGTLLVIFSILSVVSSPAKSMVLMVNAASYLIFAAFILCCCFALFTKWPAIKYWSKNNPAKSSMAYLVLLLACAAFLIACVGY